MSIRTLYTLVLAGIALAAPLAAQESTDQNGTDEDALFGGGSLVEDADDASDVSSGVDDLLTTEAATVGGNFSLSVTVRADPETFDLSDFDPFWESVEPGYRLAPTLFVDARPDPDFRVLLKANIDYTTAEGNPSREPGAEVRVEELFSDVTLADWLYLRGGKQNMSWGVGYFFSPADLVSLEGIDSDDPEAEREGPVAVRLHAPFGTTNAYAYAMLDDLPNAGHAGYAGKLEGVLAGAELTAGGYYERESVSAVMATYSGNLWDFDLFAEAVARYGSTITIVEDVDPVPTTKERADQWFGLATAGARYSWSDDLGYFNLSLLGQYFYNGEGYEDPSILQDDRIPALLASSAISPADLRGTGLHYAASSLSWSGAFGSDLSPSAFWIGNISDGSGRVSVDLRYAINAHVSVTPSYSYAYGEDRDEYALGGTGHAVSIRASLGSGRF